jgi:hypothetical protein
MPGFSIKYFNGGFSDFNNIGVRGSFKGGKAQSIRRRAATLTCNQALVEESSGTLVDLPRFAFAASDGNSYLFGSAKIYKRTSGGTLSVVYTDSDGGIIGAGEWWVDNGKKYLYWATATKLHCKEIPGNSGWSDVDASQTGTSSGTQTYPKTNLTSTTWHTMNEANADFMICNDNTLAMVGYDGSYTNNALQLTPDQVARVVIDRADDAVVGTGTKSGQQNAHIFSWTTNSLKYERKKKVPAIAINAMIDSEVLIMQADTDGKLLYSDFFNFQPVTAFPQGGTTNPGGVVDISGVIYFGVFNATDTTQNGIWSYGRNKKNGLFTLNFEYPITCDEVGCLFTVGTTLFCTYKVTGASTYKLMKVDSTAKQTAVFESLEFSLPSTLIPKHLSFKGVKLLTTPLPASCTIACAYKVDKASSWTSAYLDGNIATMATTNAQEAYFKAAAPAKIVEVQLTLTPSGNTAPEVIEAEVLFE